MTTNNNGWLRLNIQHFAEPDPEPTPEPELTPEPEVPTYTQSDIDRIVGERLAREKAKADKAIADAKADAEREKLVEESKFKTLYEAEKEAREKVEETSRKSALAAKKQALLIAAGYEADKLADLIPFITGDDEDAIVASVERFKAVAPPKPAYVDPAAGGGGRQQPAHKDGTELGRELYERVFKTKK